MRNDPRRLLSTLTLAWACLLPGAVLAESPSLALSASDVLVEARQDGYHLFIRQNPGTASVLLTEAYETTDHKLATYALRSTGPNPVNDAEKRLLDGKFLPQPHRSLMSSTPNTRPGFGASFEVVLPVAVEYGSLSNPNSRYGKLDVKAALATPAKPFWFSIRAFAKPYADYTGAYRDNAFELKSLLVQTAVPTADRYESGLSEGFSRFGTPYRARDIQDALDFIRRTLVRSGDSLDLVVAVDTTKSMVLNLQAVKAGLLPSLKPEIERFKVFRIGIVLYRDYLEDYLTRSIAFSSDLEQVQRDLDSASAAGGGDIPEAVVEALWTSETNFRWTAANRIVVLLGDAPQHPSPRGEVTEAQVRLKAEELHLELEPILLPQTLP